jgi:hypothetical protein
MADPRDRYDPDLQKGVDWWLLAVAVAFVVLCAAVVALITIS